MSPQELLGIAAMILGLIGYAPYLQSIFAGKTKPHAFSWLVWAIIMSIAFAIQVSSYAGAGAWVTGAQAVFCLVIFLLALVQGERSFPLFDWLALTAALLALLLWIVAKNPILSIILLSLTDTAGFLPTYRKGFQKPFEDSISVFAMSAIAYIFSILALESFSLTTWLYPATLILTNTMCVTLLLVRRKYVQQRAYDV